MADVIGSVIGKIAGLLGFDGTYFRPVKTDAAGELQIDVLTSALPAGAALEVTQAAIQDAIGSRTAPAAGTVNARLAEIEARVGDETAPAGGTVNAQLQDVRAELLKMTDYRYQGDHLKVFAAGLNIGTDAWGDIITQNCPAGKVWYLIGWSVSCQTVDLLYRVLVQKAGVNVFQFYGVNGAMIFQAICFAKFTAGQQLKVRGYHSAGVDTYFLANAVLIEENA